MDDILKSAWGSLLNENEKLATLLDEKDSEIERLRAENAALRSDNLRQWAALTEMASLNLFAHQYRNRARAALAGKVQP